jgi:hypothetical protein
MVVYWRPRKKEPWFLATDVEWGWRKVVGAHGLRMGIEELLRDEKNVRFGRGRRQTKVSDAQRLERLLLILVGKEYRGQYWPGHRASAVGRRRQTSDFLISRYMQAHIRFGITVLLRLLADRARTPAQRNWG